MWGRVARTPGSSRNSALAKDAVKEVERAARKAAGQLQEAEGKLQPHPTGGTEG